MQDEKPKPTAPLDPDAVPASHDDLNQPGMTNGVPDQLSDAKATGRPGNERQDSEGAAGADGSGS